MNESKRDALIDRYFEIIDSESYDRLDEVFHDDVTLLAPGSDLDGLEQAISWYENRLTVDDPTHDVRRRLHTETASVCEGWLTGTVPAEGPLEGGFLDVIEFDPSETEITQFAIYTRF
jgi:ketosteroid isomerase-like protein